MSEPPRKLHGAQIHNLRSRAAQDLHGQDHEDGALVTGKKEVGARAMDIKNEIRQFIFTNFYVAKAAELANDASLLESGIIDSTGVLEVIAFLEGSFGIQVEDT